MVGNPVILKENLAQLARKEAPFPGLADTGNIGHFDICDWTIPNEADVGNNHFELGKQMCCKVKICQILYGGLRWPLEHIL